jgi:uncharacterized protein YfaT (DUF1175 family)
MDLAGVSREVAEEALAKHKEVWLAVDALMERPVVAGDKFIPPKPKVNTGLTSEQEALCERGRWLQDRVNAVFSVAHSKIQTQPVQEEVPEEQGGHQAPPSSPELVLPVLQLDSDERSPPRVRQSDSLH